MEEQAKNLVPESVVAEREDTLAGAEGSERDPRRPRHSVLLIVFLVLVTDLLGFAIVLPLLPRYGEDLLQPVLPQQSQAWLHGMILGTLLASFSLMQFIFAPIWGRTSDRVGRRPILLLGLVGSVSFYSLFGIASAIAYSGHPELGLALMFISRIGAGIAGATISIALAVIADCTSPDKRAHAMALVGAAFGIGFFLGPILGAVALKFFPDYPAAPGYAAACFSLLALIIAAILLPETLQPGVSERAKKRFNLQAFQHAFRIPLVGALVLTYFLSTLAFGNFEATLAFLTKDLLGLSNEDNYWVFAYVGFVLAAAQGGLYRSLARRGVQEATFMVAGACLMVFGMVALGGEAWFASTAGASSGSLVLGIFLVTSAVAVVGFSFMNPSINSLVSRLSGAGQQGEILGVNASANALSRILGPMAGVLLYYILPSLTLHTLPYLFATALLIPVFGLSVHVRRWIA
jgi:MFS family permease